MVYTPLAPTVDIDLPPGLSYITADPSRVTVCVDVSRAANDLFETIDDCLEYQGLDDEDMECINYDKLKLEIAKIWIAECVEKGLTS